MPLYEYACRTCAKRFEVIRRFEDRLTPAPCPTCAAADTSFVLSAPGMVGASVSANQPSPCATDPGACCGGACMN